MQLFESVEEKREKEERRRMVVEDGRWLCKMERLEEWRRLKKEEDHMVGLWREEFRRKKKEEEEFRRRWRKVVEERKRKPLVDWWNRWQ